MGRTSGKKKKHTGEKSADSTPKQTKPAENSPKAYDKDTEVFIAMAQELKDEGNRLFQRRDPEGALLKYEKALKLLPRNHIDVAYLRSNTAACYMQMGLSDYPRAVHECNLALEVNPKYSKALIKRARCYEALNRAELALRDVNAVLSVEPNNLTALEIAERLKQTVESRGDRVFDHPVPEYVESPKAPTPVKAVKESSKKKRHSKNEEEKAEDVGIYSEEIKEKQVENKDKRAKIKDEKKARSEEKKKKKSKADVEKKVKDNQQQEFEDLVEKKAEDKVVVEEKMSYANGGELKNSVKLVFGEDIRWAQLPVNCSFLKLREVIQERYPTSKAVLVKYKDHEGDMITITTTDELRLAEGSADPQGSVKIYIVEVSPEHDPLYEEIRKKDGLAKASSSSENGSVIEKVKDQGKLCIEEWIIPFAQLFKNYVGFSSDAYLDLHELGVNLYSEAMEETVCCEEAQILFDLAAEKFQEMAALALFNWGSIHMARARKRVHFVEDSTHEILFEQVKIAYDWAQQEYEKAGQKYEEALKIKPNLYEAHLALALQQFEQAKLSWYYAVANNVDMDTWSPTEVLDLYNNAEENIEKGMLIWEELELQNQSSVSSPSHDNPQMQRMGFDSLFKDISSIDSEEQAMSIRSQVNVLWGTMLYERSIMEYKLGLPVWHECLEVALEKFELAGASQTDIAVMVKHHCSNDSGLEGVGFRIDEIVQAWNEMDDAKRWYTGVQSFRLEPLLRRRVSKIYYALEQA